MFDDFMMSDTVLLLAAVAGSVLTGTVAYLTGVGGAIARWLAGLFTVEPLSEKSLQQFQVDHAQCMEHLNQALDGRQQIQAACRRALGEFDQPDRSLDFCIGSLLTKFYSMKAECDEIERLKADVEHHRNYIQKIRKITCAGTEDLLANLRAFVQTRADLVKTNEQQREEIAAIQKKSDRMEAENFKLIAENRRLIDVDARLAIADAEVERLKAERTASENKLLAALKLKEESISDLASKVRDRHAENEKQREVIKQGRAANERQRLEIACLRDGKAVMHADASTSLTFSAEDVAKLQKVGPVETGGLNPRSGMPTMLVSEFIPFVMGLVDEVLELRARGKNTEREFLTTSETDLLRRAGYQVKEGATWGDRNETIFNALATILQARDSSAAVVKMLTVANAALTAERDELRRQAKEEDLRKVLEDANRHPTIMPIPSTVTYQFPERSESLAARLTLCVLEAMDFEDTDKDEIKEINKAITSFIRTERGEPAQ